MKLPLKIVNNFIVDAENKPVDNPQFIVDACNAYPDLIDTLREYKRLKYESPDWLWVGENAIEQALIKWDTYILHKGEII